MQNSELAAGSKASSGLIPANESLTHCSFAELANTCKMLQSMSIVMQWGNKGAEVMVSVLGMQPVIHLPLGDWKRNIQGSCCWRKSSPCGGSLP